MAFLFPMPIETPVLAALNHVLRMEAWARERLAPFAGEVIEIQGAPLRPLRVAIAEGGLLGAPPADAQPALVVRLKPEAPSAALRGEEHLMRAVEVSGNARLADAVMHLVRHLRWDFEEDLSRLFGDVAAHRLARGARALAAWAPEAARRLAESLAVYAADEAKLVVGRDEADAFAADVARLRDAVERLEARVRRHG